MKKLSFILALCLTTGLWAQTQHVVEVESDIDEVVVSTEGAQIHRKASVDLKEGINRLIFDGNMSYTFLSGLQARVGDGLFIMSINVQENEDLGPRKNAIIKMIRDSISSIEYLIAKEQNYRYVLDMQESLLLANKELKGEDKGLVLIDLEDALLIYQKQLTSIKQGQLDSKIREKMLNDKLLKFKEQLESFSSSKNAINNQIIVLVSSPKAMKDVPVLISYVVDGVSWRPVYDVRVQDNKSSIILKYKAEIVNRSGEDWSNVKLTLTTLDNSGGNAPDLKKQAIDFKPEQPIPSRKKGDNAPRIVGTATIPQNAETNWYGGEYLNGFSFELPTKISVINNAKYSQIVDLIEYELEGEFQHFSIPKLEQNAYLLAKISGWEKFRLLPGYADIYFNNTYVSNTDLDPRITADTLNISLGKDKGVVIERKQLTDFSSTSIVGGKKRQVFVYEITVRNTKKEAVEIRIEDQIPVSMNKDITVTPINLADAEQDEESGKLSWIKRLQPNESIVIRFEYELKYPKDRVLSGL